MTERKYGKEFRLEIHLRIVRITGSRNAVYPKGETILMKPCVPFVSFSLAFFLEMVVCFQSQGINLVERQTAARHVWIITHVYHVCSSLKERTISCFVVDLNGMHFQQYPFNEVHKRKYKYAPTSFYRAAVHFNQLSSDTVPPATYSLSNLGELCGQYAHTHLHKHKNYKNLPATTKEENKRRRRFWWKTTSFQAIV